jgi:hypothetical protein
VYSTPVQLPQPKPSRIFEPVYRLHDDTLLGLMRQLYIEVTDQNRNLVVLLHEYQKQGTIRILEDSPGVFAVNLLLPVSILVWTPNR